jgi:hypothetical protein
LFKCFKNAGAVRFGKILDVIKHGRATRGLLKKVTFTAAV